MNNYPNKRKINDRVDIINHSLYRLPALTLFIPAISCVLAAEPACEKTIIFPREGNTVCRIPSIIVSKNGTLMAFADRRKGSRTDWGHDTDIVLRRSIDDGKTWLPRQTIITEEGVNFHGGPALVDRQTGRIFKFLRKRPASFKDRISFYFALFHETSTWKEWGMGSYVTSSDDNGVTWSTPHRVEIEYSNKDEFVNVGNGSHGIQLMDGTLVIQGYCLSTKKTTDKARNSTRSVLLTSNDHGLTWNRGAEWPAKYAPMEYVLVDTEENGFYINQRTQDAKRRVLRLKDINEKNLRSSLDQTLPEPTCHAGLIRLSSSRYDDQSRILFVNPGIPNFQKGFNLKTRQKLTVRLSYDEAKTWPVSRVLEEGKAGYSDLAVLENGTIFCMYEEGEARFDENIAVAQFNLEWVTEYEDSHDCSTSVAANKTPAY